jgi:hypothetical protein
MNKESLKRIIKECVKSVISEIDTYEPYDDQTDNMAPAPRDRTEPVEKPSEPSVPEEPQIDKAKIKMLNEILFTCANMQKRVHALTDPSISNGIKTIQDTVIQLMKSLGAK